MEPSSLGELQDIENRIAFLEARVGVNRGSAARQLRTRADCLLSRLSELLSERTEVNTFIEQYEELSGMLLADDVDEFVMNIETKRAVLLSCEGFFREVGELLDEMKRLERFIEPTPTPTQPFTALKRLHLDTNLQCDEFSARFERLMRGYNEFVPLASHRFLHWNHAIAELEQAA